MNNHLDLSLYKKSSIGTSVDESEEKVQRSFEYSSFDHFLLWFFGVTRYPKKISFTCIETGEVFEELKDKKLIEHYMIYCKK